MKVRKKIKLRRKDMGLTQRQVAHRIGVTRSAYANFENGYRDPNAGYLRKIGRVLHRNFG
jgi:transcriptional regulator with XRE-family HTH domain